MAKPIKFKYNKAKFDEPELEEAWQKAMISAKKTRLNLNIDKIFWMLY